MRVERRFTADGKSPYSGIEFRSITSEIRNSDGSTVFRLEDVKVPAKWSQIASDIIALKYFRKTGVAKRLRAVEESNVPRWLWRSEPDVDALAELDEDFRYGAEDSATDVFDRLAGTWTYWGWKAGYFDAEDDAQAYYDEMRYMLCT